MTYHFSKIITTIAKPQYGNFVTNERYMVIDGEDEVGQYFVTQKMDYFNFLNEELEMYSITHLPNKGKRIIKNEITNKEVGYYEPSLKKVDDINCYGEIVLGDITYSCSKMPIGKDTTHKNLMVSNGTDQLFINCEEKKNKIDINIVEVLNGTIETQTNNLLLLFTSIYFLEEMLFIGNG